MHRSSRPCGGIGPVVVVSVVLLGLLAVANAGSVSRSADTALGATVFAKRATRVVTTAVGSGRPAPILPPADPSANDLAGGACMTTTAGTAACLAAIDAARAAEEGLAPIVLPTNWRSLTGAEQLFVLFDLERVSRGEPPIGALVHTFDTAVQAAVASRADPTLAAQTSGGWGSIWGGGTGLTVLGVVDLWLYDDGPGGTNADCRTPAAPGCWVHRDIILSDGARLGGMPTEMDAVVGVDSRGAPSYAAALLVDPVPPGPSVFTWAQEQSYLRS